MTGTPDTPPPPRTARTILAVTTACAALILGGVHSANAAPAADSTSSNSGSVANGSSGPARNAADLLFLRRTDYDDADYPTQDAAIELARAECKYLDTHGNTARNRMRLAEQTRPAVKYPYLFLEAAVDAVCPWNRL
ncbi:hypothetical protein [Nocardia sp. NPDC005366]|uniref:DUF732 domain-containing protein n=1 Tax=Nocardia sp. NPDC005366 TaxID=3156878 RepID=UPI0033B0ED94